VTIRDPGSGSRVPDPTPSIAKIANIAKIQKTLIRIRGSVADSFALQLRPVASSEL